jgi:hypothetical protein
MRGLSADCAVTLSRNDTEIHGGDTEIRGEIKEVFSGDMSEIIKLLSSVSVYLRAFSA